MARHGTAVFASRLVDDFGMHLRVAPGLAAGRGHRFTRDDGATIDVVLVAGAARPIARAMATAAIARFKARAKTI